MTTIKPIMARHHEYCDRLFADAEQAANQQDWNACRQLLQHFAEAMEAHFQAEEEELFPAFERVTGTQAGPTEVMRQEHLQIRQLIASLADAAAAASDVDFFGVGDTLVVFMEQHNRKEEGILYPMCDDRIGDSEQVIKRLQLLVGA